MAARNSKRATLDGALERLSDALSIIATATNALQAVEDECGKASAGNIGESSSSASITA